MSNEIKPCPFCGSEMIEIHWIDKSTCSIECIECESKTRGFEDINEAISFWNQRPYDYKQVDLAENAPKSWQKWRDDAVKASKEKYDYDMPAIIKKVQQLEKENEQLKKMLALGVNYERANG